MGLNGVIQMSEASSIAIHALTLMAREEREGAAVLSARALAAGIHASQAHLAKVMQRLVRAGLVRSMRGPSGGFVLNRPAASLTFLDIYEAVEGPVGGLGCPLQHADCPFRACPFKAAARKVGREFVDLLGKRSLASLARNLRRDARRSSAGHRIPKISAKES